MRRHAYTIIEVLVVTAIIGILAAILLPALQAVREASSRTTCANNLKQLGLAIWAFEGANRRFPAGATPSAPQTPALSTPGNASWAVLILPYIEQQSRFDAFVPNVNVDDPSLTMAEARTGDIPLLLCPADGSSGAMIDSNNSKSFTRTNYVANLGTNGYAREVIAGKTKPAAECGLFANGVNVRADQIRDGTSQTAMLAEILRGEDPNNPANVPRTNVTRIKKPPASNLWGTLSTVNDPNNANHKTPIPECDTRPAGKFTLLAENGLRFHSGIQNHNAFYTHTMLPNDARRDCVLETFLLQSHLAARSRHPGGVNAVFADGSVHFIANDVTISVWKAMGTRAAADSANYPF